MSAPEAKALQEENADIVKEVQSAPDREAKTEAVAEIGDKRKADEPADIAEDVKKSKTDEIHVAQAKGKGKGKASDVASPEPEPENSDDDEDAFENLPPRRARAKIDYSSAEAHEVAGIDPNAADEDEKDEDAKIAEDDAENSGEEPPNDDAEEEDDDDDEEK